MAAAPKSGPPPTNPIPAAPDSLSYCHCAYRQTAAKGGGKGKGPRPVPEDRRIGHWSAYTAARPLTSHSGYLWFWPPKTQDTPTRLVPFQGAYNTSLILVTLFLPSNLSLPLRLTPVPKLLYGRKSTNQTRPLLAIKYSSLSSAMFNFIRTSTVDHSSARERIMDTRGPRTYLATTTVPPPTISTHLRVPPRHIGYYLTLHNLMQQRHVLFTEEERMSGPHHNATWTYYITGTLAPPLAPLTFMTYLLSIS